MKIRKKWIAIFLFFVIFSMVFYVRNNNKEIKTLKTGYSIAVVQDGNRVMDDIIRVNKDNNVEFNINFSINKEEYGNENYILNIYKNMQSTEFYIDNKLYEMEYEFEETSQEINMFVKIPLKELSDSNNIMLAITPKDSSNENYDHAMVLVYNVEKSNLYEKKKYENTSYETIKSDFNGIILNQEFDKSKDGGFDCVKEIKTSQDTIPLAFRVSNLTGSQEENRYILIITNNGVIDKENIYSFNSPGYGELIYKELNLLVDNDINDIKAYLMIQDSDGNWLNGNYLNYRLNIKKKD